MPIVETFSESSATFTPAIYPELARTLAGRLGPSLTLARGTALGKRTSDGKLYAYDDTKTDGTQTCVGLLVFDIATDASGNHYKGNSAVPDGYNVPTASADIYISGIFDPAEITGMDANGWADLKARLLPNGLYGIPL